MTFLNTTPPPASLTQFIQVDDDAACPPVTLPEILLSRRTANHVQQIRTALAREMLALLDNVNLDLGYPLHRYDTKPVSPPLMLHYSFKVRQSGMKYFTLHLPLDPMTSCFIRPRTS
jgi:hypothetical protein